jgi:hypothetical protein
MHIKTSKLIFELSDKEKESKFRSVLSDAIRKAASLNLPLVYRNELCNKPNLFIHQYPNGKKVMIEQDTQSSLERTVQVL